MKPQEIADVDFETLVRSSWEFLGEEEALQSLPDDLLTALVATRTAMEFLLGRSRYGSRANRKTVKPDGSSTVPEDLEAQAIVAGIIRRRCPHDGLFGEEDLREGTTQERTWLIDGLDGTDEFLKRTDNFASAVSLTQNGKATLGAVAWYLAGGINVSFAQRGCGAHVYRKGDDDLYRPSSCFEPLSVCRPRDNEPERILTHRRLLRDFLEKNASPAGAFFRRLDQETRERQDLTFILNHWEYIHPPDEAARIEAEIRKKAELETLGSSAIEQTLVAGGASMAYISAHVKPWDAAGTVLIEEAGGKVTDWRGQPRDIFSETNMLATGGGPIHDQLLDILGNSLS